MNFSQSGDWGERGFKRPVPDDPKCVVYQPFPALGVPMGKRGLKFSCLVASRTEVQVSQRES